MSASVSVTVSWSCSKTARCTSRTADRNRPWKTPAADEPVDDALDHRAHGDQVRLRVDHEVVGDPGRDLGAHRLVVERRGGPVRRTCRSRTGRCSRSRRAVARSRRTAARIASVGAAIRRPVPPMRGSLSAPPGARAAASLTSPRLLRSLLDIALADERFARPRDPDSGRRGGRPARIGLDPSLPARRAARCRRGARPTARPWSSPPTTSAPATSPVRSAPTSRPAASATTRRAAPATSPTWPRRRTSSACGSAPSNALEQTRTTTTNDRQRPADRRRERRRARGGRPGRLPAPRGLRPAPGRGDRPRRRRRAARRGRLRARRAGRGARPVRGPRRHPRRLPGAPRSAPPGWSCSATRSSRSAGSRPSPSARSATPSESSSTRPPSSRSSTASSPSWRRPRPARSAPTSPRCSRWIRSARRSS